MDVSFLRANGGFKVTIRFQNKETFNKEISCKFFFSFEHYQIFIFFGFLWKKVMLGMRAEHSYKGGYKKV